MGKVFASQVSYNPHPDKKYSFDNWNTIDNDDINDMNQKRVIQHLVQGNFEYFMNELLDFAYVYSNEDAKWEWISKRNI